MILADKLSKNFGKKEVLKDLCCQIDRGSVYGLVGANGAGKSTFLILLTGVYKQDSGSVEIDGKKVFDNVQVKKKFCFVADGEAGAGIAIINGHNFHNSVPFVVNQLFCVLLVDSSVQYNAALARRVLWGRGCTRSRISKVPWFGQNAWAVRFAPFPFCHGSAFMGVPHSGQQKSRRLSSWWTSSMQVYPSITFVAMALPLAASLR